MGNLPGPSKCFLPLDSKPSDMDVVFHVRRPGVTLGPRNPRMGVKRDIFGTGGVETLR